MADQAEGVILEAEDQVNPVVDRANAGLDSFEKKAESAHSKVKILECSEGPRFSMMDIEDQRNHMGAALSLRYRIGQPGTPAAE